MTRTLTIEETTKSLGGRILKAAQHSLEIRRRTGSTGPKGLDAVAMAIYRLEWTLALSALHCGWGGEEEGEPRRLPCPNPGESAAAYRARAETWLEGGG